MLACHCEATYLLSKYFPTIIDATRQSDGQLVCVKKVPKASQELEIIKYFSQQPLRDDPKNHCVPLLDSFEDDVDENFSYIVMPFLRNLDDPPFAIVNDILDFADQALEVSWNVLNSTCFTNQYAGPCLYP